MYDWKYRIRSGESLFNEVMLLNKQELNILCFMQTLSQLMKK